MGAAGHLAWDLVVPIFEKLMNNTVTRKTFGGDVYVPARVSAVRQSRCDS